MSERIEFVRSPKYISYIADHLLQIIPKNLVNIIIFYYTTSLNWTFSNTSNHGYYYFDNDTKTQIVKLDDDSYTKIQFQYNSQHIRTISIDKLNKVFVDFPYVYVICSSVINKINCYDGSTKLIFSKESMLINVSFIECLKNIKNKVFYTTNFDHANKIKFNDNTYSVKNIEAFINIFTFQIAHSVQFFNLLFGKLCIEDVMIDENMNITLIATNPSRSFYTLVVYDEFMKVIRKFVSNLGYYSVLQNLKILWSNTNEILYTFTCIEPIRTVLCYKDMVNNVHHEISYNGNMSINMANNLLILHRLGRKYYIYVS